MQDCTRQPALSAKTAKTRRVGVIQSCYIPWRGYFDFINTVDLFVIYDDVQYSTGSWRNRNQLKTANGLKWITLPVTHKLGMAIDEVTVGRSTKSWRDDHLNLLSAALGKAPYFKTALELWKEGVSPETNSLTQLNVKMLKTICAFLEIKVPFVFSRDFKLTGVKTERLIQLLKALEAGAYLSGPAAKDYLDEEMFRANHIALEYKAYDYPEYLQQWGAFEGAVTILDLIANMGPESRRYLKSRTADAVAVK
jgi:hypothetical protein